MADPTSNLNVIQADKIFVWDSASKMHVSLQTSIVGLAPATLNTLQALASAVGNDPAFSRHQFGGSDLGPRALISKLLWLSYVHGDRRWRFQGHGRLRQR